MRDIQQLTQFARRHGFEIKQTNGGHIRYTLQGVGFCYAARTPGRHNRTMENTLADLRRLLRQKEQRK